MYSTRKALFFLLIALLLVFVTVATADSDVDDDDEVLVTKKDVVKRNLVREHLRGNSIVENHNKYYFNTSRRSFTGNTLAYITPWNSHGYKIAEQFTAKFTHLSPVWFQIKIDAASKKVVIEGEHNIDLGWIDRVRKASPTTQLVPRFMFDGDWNPSLFEKATTGSSLADSLVKLLIKHSFDGIVLEGRLKIHKKSLFIVIQPINQSSKSGVFTTVDYSVLAPYVDGFSLMTYDYDPFGGKLAPLQWIEQSLSMMSAVDTKHNKKIMMGIPFYGYTAPIGQQKQPSAILGHEYVALIKKHKPKKIEWDATIKEHSFRYKEGSSTNFVAFPSLLFIQERLQLAQSYGCSISIWEIGQGLDYFYDLL
eukprot:gene6590-7652_t